MENCGKKEFEEGLKLYSLTKYKDCLLYFEKSAKLGYSPSIVFIIRVCRIIEKRELEQIWNIKLVILSIEQLALSEDIGAQLALGLIFKFGLGFKPNTKGAFYWFERAAQQECARAQYELGICYENGYGVEKDLHKAFYLYKKAADQNDSMAQLTLGLYNLNMGECVDEGVCWLKEAANQGNINALFNLGQYYEFKDINPEQALFWYKKAAQEGCSKAQHKTARYYSYNLRNKKQAVYWYQKAADQGHVQALFDLGWAYRTGEGVNKDLEQADKLFRKAIEKGHIFSYFSFAINNYDITNNMKEGIYWLDRAAIKGHTPAISLLNEHLTEINNR